MQNVLQSQTKKPCNYNVTLVRNSNVTKSNINLTSSKRVIVTKQGIL